MDRITYARNRLRQIRAQRKLAKLNARAAKLPRTPKPQKLHLPVDMKALAKQTGISRMTLYQRWHRGDRGERLTRQARRKPGKGNRTLSER